MVVTRVKISIYSVLTHSPSHLLTHSPNHVLTHSPNHLLVNLLSTLFKSNDSLDTDPSTLQYIDDSYVFPIDLLLTHPEIKMSNILTRYSLSLTYLLTHLTTYSLTHLTTYSLTYSSAIEAQPGTYLLT